VAWAADAPARLHRDARLPVAFEMPAGWVSRPCTLAPQCLELRPRNRRKAPAPAITIEIRGQPLEVEPWSPS